MANVLTTPLPRECLLCFAWRMLDAYGCNTTLRWTRHWRSGRAPKATALEQRLARSGVMCDCQMFLNGWELASMRDVVSSPARPHRASPAACPGVRRGSTQPCPLWMRRTPRW